MRLLLTARASIEQADIHGQYPLYLSSYFNEPDAMRLLIKARADVDRCTNTGATPLTIAALNGHIDPTRILVRAGADIAMTALGDTAEWWANDQGYHNIATFLADIREAGGYAQYSELFC